MMSSTNDVGLKKRAAMIQGGYKVVSDLGPFEEDTIGRYDLLVKDGKYYVSEYNRVPSTVNLIRRLTDRQIEELTMRVLKRGAPSHTAGGILCE